MATRSWSSTIKTVVVVRAGRGSLEMGGWFEKDACGEMDAWVAIGRRVEMDIAGRAFPGWKGSRPTSGPHGPTGRRTRAERGFRSSSAGADDDLGVPPGGAP